MNLKRYLSASLFLVACGMIAHAQQSPAQTQSPLPQPPVTTSGGSRSAQTVTPDSNAPLSVPQVVTVVHRLSGIKLLRLLRHSDAQASGVNALDEGFAATKDLHTSFVAGLPLGDGRTIVSWMPRAEAEVETPLWPLALTMPQRLPQLPLSALPPSPVSPAAPVSLPGGSAQPPLAQINGPATAPALVQLPEAASDLTVVRRDGRKFDASYIGLDGLTGLSLLQVKGELPPAPREASEERLFVGQRVRLLSPQPAPEEARQPPASGTVYLHVSEVPARLTEIKRINGGRIARLTVRAANLSPAIAGGIALNEAGETIGIVETSDLNEARIMPVAMVRRAAERVLARRASVPRPWLGVRGDAVSSLSLDSFTATGWKPLRAASLLSKREGILLTSVAKGTPAALANLHPGDIILRVNDALVKSAEDFTFMLNEAGGGASVKFTLLQPGQLTPRAVQVTLSEALNPVRAMDMSETGAATEFRLDPLVAHGAETLSLSPQAAAHFGASGGLLVLFVRPESAAASSGLKVGDVIESFDGKPASGGNPFLFPAKPGDSISLGIVRSREKLSLALQLPGAGQQK